MTTSWASIAKAPTPAPAAPPPAADEQRDASVLVVDANAIINGIRLEGIADRAVTIQEVLDEVRDRQSRQYLASLPFDLQVVEPSEESLKIGRAFSRPGRISFAALVAAQRVGPGVLNPAIS